MSRKVFLLPKLLIHLTLQFKNTKKNLVVFFTWNHPCTCSRVHCTRVRVHVQLYDCMTEQHCTCKAPGYLNVSSQSNPTSFRTTPMTTCGQEQKMKQTRWGSPAVDCRPFPMQLNQWENIHHSRKPL